MLHMQPTSNGWLRLAICLIMGIKENYEVTTLLSTKMPEQVAPPFLVSK